MIIYGAHACMSAMLHRPDSIIKIYVHISKDKCKLYNRIPKNLIHKVVSIDSGTFAHKVGHSSAHQNIAIDIANKKNANIEDLESAGNDSVVAILDGVTDAQNLGSILRNAASFNVSHIIVPEKGSCKLTGVAIKISSGGYEHVDIIEVNNLSNAIQKLQSYGYWVVALSEDGDKDLSDIDMRGKICLVFGAEGAGIKRLVRRNADFIVRIPAGPVFSTLNVSASVAIAFYEAARQRIVAQQYK